MSETITIKKSELEEVQQFFNDVKATIEEKDLEIMELKEKVDDLEKQLEPQPLGIDLSDLDFKKTLNVGEEETSNFIR